MSPPPMPEDAETYLAQLDRHLDRMPPEERARIVQEISSHLAERAAVGPQMLHTAIVQLGAPSALARSFLDDWALTNALEQGPSPRILVAILTRAARSFAAILFGAIGAVLYTVAGAFVLIAVCKPIFPDSVGAWSDGHGGWSSFGIELGHPHRAELLGWWTIPVAMTGAVLCYLLASVLMRVGGRVLLRRGR